ncbi:DapH/DapD/GlmU-related protein [Butyrivibrio sp. XPD2002]|uniref:DapH/DapD/GlmU-related protein n=1 Tax=Butyrivibrio sp. XPD2002 TaxID=1280665 RepID=UPI0004106E20|nr:DapH/DapD/GlmU-related protein [Butyrivibrio sp. XPD2002]
MSKSIKLSTLAQKLNLRYEGKDVEIDGLGLCNRDTEYLSILSYVTSEAYIDNVIENKAIVALVADERFFVTYSSVVGRRDVSFIVSEKPEVCFYRIHEALCESGELYEKYDFSPIIGNNCEIANSVVIEKGVIIGENVRIGHNTVIRSGSVIDNNVIIGCNTTIGSEGFQLITDSDLLPMHITHVGRCHICSNVYVGDNTCVCNSLFGGETYVGEGSKIDNLVHIAHNLYIGKAAVITAHVILCGSSRIEDGAWIGPNSSVLNRVIIGKGAKVGLGSVVTRDVAEFTVVYGSPAKEHRK